jgi:hypothetical protein
MRWYWRCFSRSSAPWVRLPASCLPRAGCFILPYLGEVVGGEVVGGVTLDKWLERGGYLREVLRQLLHRSPVAKEGVGV